jgi:hypothetical protein
MVRTIYASSWSGYGQAPVISQFTVTNRANDCNWRSKRCGSGHGLDRQARHLTGLFDEG